MSKRDAGSAIEHSYMNAGFLPDAVFNYLCMLGWTPKSENEKLSRTELTALFDADAIHSSNAKFDMKKAQWFNAQYLRELSPDELLKHAEALHGCQRSRHGPMTPWPPPPFTACAKRSACSPRACCPSGCHYFFREDFPFEADVVTKLKAKPENVAMHASLSSMQMVACATLGVTSLAGGFMLWRLDALNKRFDRLSRQIQDLEDTLDAQNKAHLRNAIQKLREYDSTGDRPTLTTAKNEAQTAANIYGQLTCNEAMAKTPRLEVLNYRGRCYLLALLTELRTRLLEESLGEAVTRFEEERQTIESLARATFTQSIGESPAPFLAESTKEEGISLDVMTEIYQHAQRLGAFTEAEIRNPSDMFEYCRSKGISGRPFIKLPFIHESGQDLSKRLKYLMACFEDIGRVESLKLLADHIKKAAMPFNSLQSELKKWQEKEKSNHSEEAVFAYSFA
jgi:hypothetical protein